MYTKFGERYLL